MKTINFFIITIIAFIFAVSFSSSSYSNELNTNCKCCDEQCTIAGCCKDCGLGQENSNCCSDKCANEKCTDCCAGGSCSMMNNSNVTGDIKNRTDNNLNSYCSENKSSDSLTKDCCN